MRTIVAVVATVALLGEAPKEPKGRKVHRFDTIVADQIVIAQKGIDEVDKRIVIDSDGIRVYPWLGKYPTVRIDHVGIELYRSSFKKRKKSASVFVFGGDKTQDPGVYVGDTVVLPRGRVAQTGAADY